MFFSAQKKINVVALIFIKTTTFIIEPQKKVSANAETLINNGAPGTIRTCDTRLRSVKYIIYMFFIILESLIYQGF